MSRGIERVKKAWAAEAPRQFLWLPVCFAVGISAYFSLPMEPPLWLLPGGFVASLLLAITCWQRARIPLLAFCLIAAGAAWANLYADQQRTQVLPEALSPRPILGTVTDIQRTEHGVRLTLDRVTISEYPPKYTPERVRVSLRLKKDAVLALPHIGDTVNLRAGLRPPMGPALPHGFDFSRYFYFRGIGAVGYGLPPWRVVGEPQARSVREQFWDWRIRITEEIIATLGKETGGIAAGLTTGDARAITEEDFDALRASNLYHIIAISGEHMVVIAGVIFISLRLLALLLPQRIAYRPQVKSLAALVTLVLVTAYLFVTGLPISAVRAYVMIFLVLLAVILHRQVDAMRSLSLAALIMLLFDPASILEPGFRLSFAATLAIIALVETAILRPKMGQGRISRGVRLLFTMLMISVVAEAATAPLVISMFNNLSIYGVLANMLATPLVSLFLMPAVALYFILLPLGLHGVALWLMDWGIRGLLGIAHFIAALPHAQVFLPSIPGYGIALFALGLLWLCLWQTPMRRYGALLVLLGIATMAFHRAPDLLVGGELKQIALRTEDGYALARGKRNAMVPELWANGLGYKQLPKASEPDWQCDALGCMADVRGKRIAFPKDAAALVQDCAAADLVFTLYAESSCGHARLFGKTALAGSNVVAIWIDDELHIEKSADWQGSRPWSAETADDELAGE